ncbi:hypothetical protein ACQPYH_28785 [Kribbella sp. CA-245084]|uniref:hypothetical protein n=1 Tax=Kribbella sp. CA-245084 TaxID=3239940 RepID=UPI003D8FCEEE
MNDPGFAIATEERRRLLEANAAAARFYRRELLRATGGWPVDYLKAMGAERVLSTDSTWRIGYAPDTWSNLVDHLRSEGFSHATMVRAGLMTWTADGDATDRYRDQLMLIARNDKLLPVGFIGIGPDGQARSLTPDTAIHRPSNVLVGIEEQLDLLRDGASPVIVDDPVDAIALGELGGQWAGVPVCGKGLSTAQARMLRKFSMSDTAVVVVSGNDQEQKLSTGYMLDLALHFDRVRAFELPCSLREFVSVEDGRAQLLELLTTEFVTVVHRSGGRAAADMSHDPEPPDRGPEL